MPLSPFHLAIVWPLFLWKPKKFDFIALSLGALLPDILLPFGYLCAPECVVLSRILSHSLLALLTVFWVACVLLSWHFVPWLIRRIDRSYPDRRWRFFGGLDVTRDRILSVVVYSSVIAGISHAVLDLFMHKREPFLYPGATIDLLPFDDLFLSQFIVNVLVAIPFVFMLARYWYWQEIPQDRATTRTDDKNV